MENKEIYPSSNNSNPAPSTPPPANQATITPTNINNSPPLPTTSGDAPSLDKVESGYGSFIKKRWWLIVVFAAVSVAIAILALPYGVIFFVLATSIMKYFYENSLFKAFAAANNFTFQKEGTLPPQAGLIFNIGRGRRFQDIVTGTFRQRPLLVFVYVYTIGFGRNSRTFHRAVVSIDFNTNLPPFILRRHSRLQFLEEEGESLKSRGFSEKINLEGDFNKYFQVFIQPNSQDDVLSVLTPDLMQMLIGLDKYEVEMTQNGILYVYCHSLISKKQDLLDIYSIIEALTPKIGQYADRQQRLRTFSPQAAN